MSAAPILTCFGGDLTGSDYARLAERWITCELADEAGIRRVDSLSARQMFGRKRGDLSGIIIPNVAPWDTSHVREYRLRLDNPDLESRSDGSLRETNKYIQPADRRNLVHFPVGLPASALEDTKLPVLIVEGEFKAIALLRLAQHNSTALRFAPIAFAGVWNWQGIVGKGTGRNGDRCNVRGVIPDVDRIVWKDRQVAIAYDADADQNPKVYAARMRLATALIERGAVVGHLHWPIEEGKGIDDWLATIGPDRVLGAIAVVEYGGWDTRLLRNEDGRILPCYDNVALMLENSPEWAGVLGYNEFTAGYCLLKQPPPPITGEIGSEIEDHFDTEVVRYLERKRLMVKPDVVRRVVDVIARGNSYHPVRDYLESLPAWDGVPRIGTWLIDYCGVDSSDENPNQYAMAVGEKFLISAVARILKPGCKVDHLLILEGAQGIGKSTAARVLAGDEWFSDQLADMGSKDASMQLRGIWIMEMSELEALNRTELARAKAFLSQPSERFRLPYGRRLIRVPRQCVFIGTTNSDAWLKDETGGRRFWPVRCQRIDIERLASDRDQIWAEALARYHSGVNWWIDEPDIAADAMEEQRGRYVADVWQEKVKEYAEELAQLVSSGPKAWRGRGTVSITEILQRLGIEMPKQDQTAATRVARCLRAEGWERWRVGPRSDREWRYRKMTDVSQ